MMLIMTLTMCLLVVSYRVCLKKINDFALFPFFIVELSLNRKENEVAVTIVLY